MSQTWSPGGDIRCLWITWGLQRPLKAILTLKLNNWSQNDLWWFLGEWLRIRHNFIIGGRQWCQCPNGGRRSSRPGGNAGVGGSRRWCSLARLHTTPARRLLGALLRSPRGRKNWVFYFYSLFYGWLPSLLSFALSSLNYCMPLYLLTASSHLK